MDRLVPERAPAEEAHMIPTQSELLFTTVLLTVVISDGQERSLSPRAWLKWRDDELNAAFAKLEEQAARWSVVVLTPSLDTSLKAEDQGSLRWWHSRVGAVRSMFARLRADTEADEELKLRSAPLDPRAWRGFARICSRAQRTHGCCGMCSSASRRWSCSMGRRRDMWT